jgi:glyoxylate/hydroxypyruvate reductase A
VAEALVDASACAVPAGRRPVLLYACNGVDHAAWLEALRRAMPDVEIRVWPDAGEAGEIDYAFVWKYPPGLLAGLPALKGVFSLGAGVESIVADATIPPHVPIVRMVDPGLGAGMNEFVLMRVLHYHRQMPLHEANQRAHRWERLVPPLAEDRRVGLLGLGELGGRCARTLASLGFDVAGWSRSPRRIEGVRAYAGSGELDAFLERTEILVCLLPLTPDTEGLIDARTLARLPRGACLINVARGQHVVDADLLAALDSGHVAGATLDTFRVEPLPAEDPYWSHPRVTVVPHVAAITQVKSAARTLAASVAALARGELPAHTVDRSRGY